MDGYSVSDNYKKRVQDALNKYVSSDAKEIRKLNGTELTKKYSKPEKITEEECVTWMKKQGWEIQIIESKAIYNPKAGTYLPNPGVKSGNADCQGIMPDGISIAVEFKANGKLS